MKCLRSASSTAAVVSFFLLVVFFVGMASAGDVGQSVFDELLRASRDARVLRSRAAIQQAAEEGIELRPWYSVGPFKDEAYGNLVQSFEHEFTPQRDVLATGNGLLGPQR